VRRLVLAAALTALAAPAAASGATITAGPTPVAYGNPDITINAGEAVTFTNLDLTAPHDVTALDIGPGARPLFSSQTVGFATSVPVTGAEKLEAGSYDFLCSVHTFMTGSITVRGGGGGGGGSPPLLKLIATETKLAKVARAGKLRFRTKLDEKATVRVTAKAGGAKVAAGKAKLDRGDDRIAAKLTSKGKRLVAKGGRLKLAVTGRATDGDGDSSSTKVALTLR
jgi:plastocyanin